MNARINIQILLSATKASILCLEIPYVKYAQPGLLAVPLYSHHSHAQPAITQAQDLPIAVFAHSDLNALVQINLLSLADKDNMRLKEALSA